jgi:hypothetical protein
MRLQLRFATLCLTLLIAALAALPARCGEIPPAIGAMDAGVHAVVSGGYWSSDGKEGFFRAIVTAEGIAAVNHSLFVQWMGINIEAGTYTVESTVAIDEINAEDSGGHVIAMAMDDTAEFGTLRLLVTVTRPRSEKKTRYALSADGTIGAYRLAPAK